MSNYPHPPGRSEPDRLLCELVEYLAGAGLADEAPICRQAKRYTDRLRDREATAKRWILVDYDCSGLFQVQARDEHPERESLDDDAAVDLCRKEAEAGDAEAVAAIEAHDRDAHAIDDRHRSQRLFDEPKGVALDRKPRCL